MNQITLQKGQLYKLKPYKEYIIVCPSKNVTLKLYTNYECIPSLFTVTGCGKRRKLHPYSTYRKNEKGKLEKCGWVGNIYVESRNYRTIRTLTLKESIAINVLLRQENYVYNKKTDKLIKLR